MTGLTWVPGVTGTGVMGVVDGTDEGGGTGEEM